MKQTHFLSRIDDARLHAAIDGEQSHTTGIIRVFVSRRPSRDPLIAAERHFHALRLDRVAESNAILIFVAPPSHGFAIFGGEAIHQLATDAQWSAIRDEMTEHFKQERFNEALLHAVHRAGELLRTHFPR